MIKSDFPRLAKDLVDFKGHSWDDLFLPGFWVWHYKTFKWVNMMTFQIYETDFLGFKIRQECVTRNYTYWTEGHKRNPFTTRIYYLHPNGGLRKSFIEALSDAMDARDKTSVPTIPIYAL